MLVQRQMIPGQTWNQSVYQKDSFDAEDRLFFHQAHQTPPPETALMRLNQNNRQLPAKSIFQTGS